MGTTLGSIVVFLLAAHFNYSSLTVFADPEPSPESVTFFDSCSLNEAYLSKTGFILQRLHCPNLFCTLIADLK